ncbi:MAG: diaminopimelate decarboxylase [Ignavibacteriaceae bacterium]|jgi:diaminopimelate decarboxylase
MFNKQLIKKIQSLNTPFYYYDVALLRKTLEELKHQSSKRNYIVHYAVKANSNKRILKIINEFGLGADCVSGNEILRSIECGFNGEDIVFAGVGKSDEEILIGLKHNIFSFNVESVQELGVIDSIAKSLGVKANIALRINPNLDAKTHSYVTTGIEENKFGINRGDLPMIIEKLPYYINIKLTGLHFHVGSQVTDLNVFKNLCTRINEVHKWFNDHNIEIEHINAGGGLGVDYGNPDENPIPDFYSFFSVFEKFLELKSTQHLHFELGRTIVAQSGLLFSKVLYVKEGVNTYFIILDAGMTELIRPALYQSYHKIENLSSNGIKKRYDVVGPICETSDTFGKSVLLPETKRKDLMVIRSVGAYGEVMSSHYNLRPEIKSYFSD